MLQSARGDSASDKVEPVEMKSLRQAEHKNTQPWKRADARSVVTHG
jgi:hypothetical protein